MSKLWIKICGITRAEDARVAAAAGADALGAVFYPPSSRALDPGLLSTVFADVPETVRRVGLFVNPEREEVEQICGTGYIDWLQFHGDESPAFCESFGWPYLKALRVGGNSDVAAMAAKYDSARLLLFDTYDESAPGGTGKAFDWDIVKTLPDSVRVKLVLAGGLDPHNVADAVRQTRPFGVDVSSGVESAPGIKDADKINAFIEGARNGQHRI